MKAWKALLIGSAFSFSSLAAAQSGLVADVMFSGGMPIPNGPTSYGTALYRDGRVVYYRNFPDVRRNTAKVVAYLTSAQMNKLLAAGANLSTVTLVRDTSSPQCMDAPYKIIKIANRRGEMIPIADLQNCRKGERPDSEGYLEAFFLDNLNHVAEYGQF